MKSGIYLIRNKVNGKVYIGQSVDVKRRMQTHKYKLIKNIHPNTYIQHSVNKYGIENFQFKIIEKCDISFLEKKVSIEKVEELMAKFMTKKE